MSERRFQAVGLPVLLVLICAAAVWLVVLRAGAISFTGSVAERRQREAAVLFSGDAGFLGAGPAIAQATERLGLPVYGVSSLAEFRDRRTVPETVRIVNQAVRTAMRKYTADRILLIGHSFGADVIGTALPDLAPDVRKALIGVVLVVPTEPVYLRADPTGLSYRGPPDAGIDRLRSVTWVPLLCIQGQQETDSACPKLSGPNVTVVALPGGHGLHHDMARLSAVLDQRVQTMLQRRQS